MNTVKQRAVIDDVLRLVNTITQNLVDLQNEVVKLKVVEEEMESDTVNANNQPPTFIMNEFSSFSNELIDVIVKDNLVTISYIKSGQIATFNKEEIYDIFINLPTKFDRATVANCSRELGIASKNETLLMRFFIYQFSKYCEKTSKGSKDKLVIKKL